MCLCPCIINFIVASRIYQPSPHASSSSDSFGFKSSFFATVGFVAGFAEVVVFLMELDDFDKPLGNGFAPGFLPDRSANQAAKSGSPSSKGVAEAAGCVVGFVEVFEVDTVPSSSMSPIS